ncbi:unnamed protein product [Paramecium sonneborni]|uniref:Uncharacterized protein n=1 Tax=Paramecium sonneborni TaxID=65129 RepID=A0A8S1Q0Y4_9CILI|nr:unnamed protein product [Paramecium sonneborni]
MQIVVLDSSVLKFHCIVVQLIFYKKNSKFNKWVLFYILQFNLGGLVLFTNYLLWA